MSGIFKVIITPDAQNDIRNYVRYIAQELANPQAAAALQEELRKEISSLNTMPARYKTIDEQPWGSIGVRKFKVKNYYRASLKTRFEQEKTDRYSRCKESPRRRAFALREGLT